MDDLTKIVLTAFGTLVVGLIAALVGAWIQLRREHSKWIREERMATYIGLLQEMEKVKIMGGATIEKIAAHPKRGQMFDAVLDAEARLALVGPDKLVVLAMAMHEAMVSTSESATKQYYAARADFVETARPEVGIRKAGLKNRAEFDRIYRLAHPAGSETSE
jgi:hypothetical protein